MISKWRRRTSNESVNENEEEENERDPFQSATAIAPELNSGVSTLERLPSRSPINHPYLELEKVVGKAARNVRLTPALVWNACPHE